MYRGQKAEIDCDLPLSFSGSWGIRHPNKPPLKIYIILQVADWVQASSLTARSEPRAILLSCTISTPQHDIQLAPNSGRDEEVLTPLVEVKNPTPAILQLCNEARREGLQYC
jgi:hypothetical protein